MGRIDHELAEEIRGILSDIQAQVCSSVIPTEIKARLVEYISTRGFREVDRLEDVIR